MFVEIKYIVFVVLVHKMENNALVPNVNAIEEREAHRREKKALVCGFRPFCLCGLACVLSSLLLPDTFN